MNIKDLIVVFIVAVVLGLAVFYIIRQKKKGVKCIGCPSGACCPSKGTGECTCMQDDK